jgi:hypothetical protein
MTFAEWYAKRVISRVEYERLKAAGELDPMGVYCIKEDKQWLTVVRNLPSRLANSNRPSGGGSLYPEEMRPLAQFEPAEDGQTWNIYGCCGGGCFVVTEMRFCPYCGTSL